MKPWMHVSPTFYSRAKSGARRSNVSVILQVIDDVLKLDPEQRHLLPLRGIMLHAMKQTVDAKEVLESLQKAPSKKGSPQEIIPAEEVELLKRALEEVPSGGIEVVQHILMDDKKKSMNPSEAKDTAVRF
jgi:hypothetical protein